MENTITILILIALSIQVLPVAIGIDVKKGLISFWHGFILIASQLLFIYAGLMLGNRFFYLLENYRGIVIFVGFFMIGIRMLIDVFKIRKGERTYFLDNTATLILASVAQGVNTFLAGLVLNFVSFNIKQIILVMAISALIFTGIGMLLKAEKKSFAFSALFIFLSGVIMLFASVYLGFFN